MTKAKSLPKSPKSPKTPPSRSEESRGSAQPPSLAADYERFLAEATALPGERVSPCRTDVNLIFANVQSGLAAVLPHLDRLRAEMPMVRADRFSELSEVAGALLYAAAQVAQQSTPLKHKDRKAKFARLLALREPMLKCAEVLAMLELLPAERVAQIRSGNGALDAAQDGIALADLYAAYESTLHNKHPFTSEQFVEIAKLGHDLLLATKPHRARSVPTPDAVSAIAARDRMYSLLAERYADLRRAGFYLFGDEVQQKVPILGARRAYGKQDPATPQPTPPAVPPGDQPAVQALAVA